MRVRRGNGIYSIGVFSKATGVSTRSLRYYDKKGYLKPEYTSEETKYRYYSENQFGTLTMLLCSDFDVLLSKLPQFGTPKDEFDLLVFIADRDQELV